MTGHASSPVLRGRGAECETLDALLAGARAGRSGVLVLRGEPGVGKTALLTYAEERAAGCHVRRAAGVESEMELAYAGLHLLCAPLLDRLAWMPEPQRNALGTALGLLAGDVPDRFLVGLALLGVLSEAAGERPLVCLVDDVQWLDRASAQALAFAARRMLAEPVALILATREADADGEWGGLPQLEVRGLCEDDARALLGAVVRAPLDERVRDRIVAETRGNPLALLELPRGLTPAQLAGGFGLPTASPLPSQIEERFRRRLENLSAPTRRLLLVAAAEPGGDPGLVWRAAERIGLGVDAAAPAAAAGLLEIGDHVRFRHPLVRSAVYRDALPGDRRLVHRALAEVIDPGLDPDRRAWHRAQAAPGTDEEVAAELERSAGRAQARGGVAAAAAFLEQATELTPDPARLARRALAAAQAKLMAGEPNAALALLALADAGTPDRGVRARVKLQRAQLAFASSRGSDAPALLLEAAAQLEPLDLALARETYRQAFSAAMFAGRLETGTGLSDVARAARAAPPAARPQDAHELLLDGLALLFTDGYAAGAPVLRRSLAAFLAEDISGDDALRWLWLADITAAQLWDDESWHRLAVLHLDVARRAGALTELPLAANSRIYVHLFAGELDAAVALVDELEAAIEVTGMPLAPYGALGLAAWRGREAAAVERIDGAMRDVMARGEGIGVTVAQWANAALHNGLGHYEEALAAGRRSTEYPQELSAATNWGTMELIEAAARCRAPEQGTAALERLSASTRASGTDWGLGVEALMRALLSDGAAAERLYREAIDRLGHTRAAAHLARAHLVYGEWLRRERRRLDAREQLRTAHARLTAMGMEAFATRAARELLATGETARRRTPETSDVLTAQEGQVARLARDGLSNPEIGAQLYISPRTVQYHLHKVFAKLTISSRTQLAAALADQHRIVQPPPCM